MEYMEGSNQEVGSKTLKHNLIGLVSHLKEEVEITEKKLSPLDTEHSPFDHGFRLAAWINADYREAEDYFYWIVTILNFGWLIILSF